MKNKKVNLRVWMFLKIAPSALLVAMYWTNVRTSYHSMHIATTLIIIGFFCVFSYYDKKADLFDEFAKDNLKRTDSVCLKTAYAFGTISVFASILLFSNRFLANTLEVTGIMIGYGIVLAILFFTILRAIIFSIIDKRGL